MFYENQAGDAVTLLPERARAPEQENGSLFWRASERASERAHVRDGGAPIKRLRREVARIKEAVNYQKIEDCLPYTAAAATTDACMRECMRVYVALCVVRLFISRGERRICTPYPNQRAVRVITTCRRSSAYERYITLLPSFMCVYVCFSEQSKVRLKLYSVPRLFTRGDYYIVNVDG